MAIDLEISGKRVQTVYTLTSMQENMLSYGLRLRQPGLDIEQVIGELHEQLDADAFAKAWKQVFKRHAVLRTGFRWGEEGKPVQEVYDNLELDFIREDWMELASTDQQESFAAWLRRDREQGFNPGVPPLMRVTLIRFGGKNYRFIWTFHHLLLDSTAFAIVLKEVFAFYEAARENYELGLGTPVSFHHYLEWTEQQDFEPARSFWRQNLRDFTEPTPLSAARTTARRLKKGEAPYGEQRLELSKEETGGLKTAAQRFGVTLGTFVEAGWGLLLGRYSGQDDVVFGGVRACRSSSFPGVKAVVGLLINTVPVRVRIDPEAVIGEWLKLFRQNQLSVRSHEQTPLSTILECRDPQAPAQLFETPLNYQNRSWQEELSDQGEEWDSRKFSICNQPNYPLWADCHGGRHLTLKIGYGRRRFEDDSIQRMLEHFKNLVCGLASQPAARVRDLKMLGEAERQSLLVDWNQTEEEYPKDKCVHEVFEMQAALNPDALAVADGKMQLSYAELNQRANQLANRLRGRGIGPETVVGICLERSADFVLSALSVLKAGGAYLPLDPGSPQQRLRFMLKDAQARLLLTWTGFKTFAPEGIESLSVDSEDLSQAQSENLENPASTARPANLAYVIYTSGSTGTPKGVAIEHQSLMNLTMWHQRAYEVGPEDRATQVANPAFDASVWEIWPYLAAGASLHVPDEMTKVDSARLLNWLRDQRITMSFLPTPLAEAVMAEPSPSGMSLRVLLTGGDKLHRPAPKGFCCWLTNHYGPTESTVVTSAGVVERDADPDTAPPIGYPIANTKVYLLDRFGEPVPVGAPGELHVSGIGLARGYVNQPELTAQRFVPNPFANGSPEYSRLYRTGDLARYLPDGNLEFLGRLDEQLKVRGVRIEPGEIELALAQYPGVRKAIVLLRTGGNRQDLTAYIVSAGRERPGIAELRSFLAKRVPEYMVPSAYTFLDSIPLTANGKVDRRRLADLELEPERISEAPATATELKVAEVWAGILGHDTIQRDDNFFDLGGHSLQATRVMSRLQACFRMELPLQLLFETPTVSSLAAAIDARNREEDRNGKPVHRVGEESKERAKALLVSKSADTIPLSFAQERIWFFEQLEPGIPLHNVPMAMELQGELNLPALERAINEMVRRHGSLRTSIVAVNGFPVARENPAIETKIPKIDLTGLPEKERQAEAQELADEEAGRPFDLSASPLLRARVLKLGRDDHWLLLTTHHIVSDGWSMGIFHRELEELYEAFSGGKEAGLDHLRWHYSDYVSWQRQRMDGVFGEQQLAYWKRQLAGVPAVVDLPTDRPRKAAQTYRGAVRFFELARELSQPLKDLARAEKATLFMVLMAGFQSLLSRYSGQNQFLVGTPIAGRTRPESEDLVGLFLNTQVLKADLGGDPTVRELLGRVRTAALEAYENQELPFEKLVEALHPERDLSRSPLFQVMFVLQNEPLEAPVLPGLAVRPIPVHSGTSKYDLTLSLHEQGAGLNGYVEYSTDLFDRETIARLIGHYEMLLRGMAANPEEKMSGLGLLTSPEQRQLLHEWTHTQTRFERGKCIHAFFEDEARLHPEAVAVRFEEKQATYDELNKSADALAMELRALGVGPEVGVAICVNRSIEMMAGLLGILKAGGYYVPLDPGYPRERLAFMLQDSQAAVLLTGKGMKLDFLPAESTTAVAGAESQSGNQLRLIRLDSGANRLKDSREKEGLIREVTAANLAYMIYTSGSTGRPKGVMVTHRNVANLFAGMDQLLGTRPGVWLALTSISFDISVLELFWTLARGYTVVIHGEQGGTPANFDGERANGHRSSVADQIIRHKVTHLQCTPSLAGTLVLAPESVQAMRSLSKLLLGGEALPFSLAKQLREIATGEILNMYGPTETTVWSSAAPIGHGDGPITIGKPIANTRIYILDQALQPVPVGLSGELYIGGEGVARGYFKRPELTGEKFIQDPFSNHPDARLYRTGDIARYKATGEIEFLGRADQQIKLRGHRIELGEIETALRKHPLLKEAAVRVWENPPNDKRLAAYVVGANGEIPGADALRRFLEEQLPAVMVPSSFTILKGLPLTPNGKVDRKALPEPQFDRSTMNSRYVAPGTELENKIAQVWRKLLKIEQVGLNDNFFDLGGHSLLAVQAQAQLEEALSVDLPVVKLFQYPTVKSLAAFLSEQGANPVQRVHRGALKQAAYARRTRREQEVAR